MFAHSVKINGPLGLLIIPASQAYIGANYRQQQRALSSIGLTSVYTRICTVVYTVYSSIMCMSTNIFQSYFSKHLYFKFIAAVN